MIIKGSLGYDIHGRKRKQVGKRSKKAKPNFTKQQSKQFKKSEDYPSAPVGEYTVPEDTSYKKDISKQYTVSIAYNKGAYQVIPKGEVKDIGK